MIPAIPPTIRLWLLLGAAAALFGAGAAAGWNINGWRLAVKHAEELKAQEKALVADCQADKKITREVSDDFQKKNRLLNKHIDDLNRVHNPSAICVPVAGAAGGSDGAAAGAGPAGAHGVNAGALLAFAGEAERYRLQLIACQEFITRTWKAKGQ
jgi:hypothetical protein